MKVNGKSRLLAILMTFIMTITFYGGASTFTGGITSSAATDDGVLNIKSVEVVQEGEFQSLYRGTVHKGKGGAEDPGKYYTDRDSINLKDPRIFTFDFTVDAETVGEDPDAFLGTVDLNYGGYALEEWANTPGARGSKNTLRKDEDSDVPYLVLNDKSIEKDGSAYKVTMVMETKCPWSPASKGTNIPFDGYYAGRQLYEHSDGQSADNRWWWQTTPTKQGLGKYAMTAVADGKELATRDMSIVQYDDANSWIEKNEFAQSLVKAINGVELSKSEIAAQKTGLIAEGRVTVNEKGEFVEGTGRSVWVEVSILGYGLTDNEKEENAGFNNYARYNPIWNIVVAYDEDTVDTYLNETKVQMNEDPDVLINKYKDAAPSKVDMVNVYYQTNVHPDEISGIDTEIQLIKDLIEGGQRGKDIDYYTWTEDDMNLRYRDPAEGYEKSETGHAVKGGYEGIFKDSGARTKKKFNTGDALEKFIFVSNITTNPDGQAGMRRTNRYAFDLNRDAVFSTMPETIALTKDIMKWDPLVLNEWHGYVGAMLIEPCTAPHDPAYDYDLLANNMRNLSYAAGYAVTANTAYNNFVVPWDHYDGGDWDDGGTIYGPMFAELIGCYGYTIEFPHSNSDSYDAGNVINYAMIDELLNGTTDVYEGNRLNGPLKDINGNMRDSHSVDVIDRSMRKNSILAKLMTKKRGIENVDSMAADKYFIDKKLVLDENNEPKQIGTDRWGDPVYEKEDLVVGRTRPEGKSFFPDYIVIPQGEMQYNFAEGIKAINQMHDWGIKVDVSTEDVEYGGRTIPAGSYVLSMYQAHRNVIFEVMSKGYDATGFADMYADIYCNLPDVRGFDSIQVYGKDVFAGKTEPQTDKIKKQADIAGEYDNYVSFKSQSTDAVRFVNYLLSKKANVWMLRTDIEGVGEASDFVIQTKDLGKITKVKDNPVIGINGTQIEGKYISELPDKAAPLTEPVIQLNSARTSQTGGALWYLLDDYLGFGSLKDYNGGTKLRTNANVIIANNVSADGFQDSWVNAIKDGDAGVIFIRNAAGLGKLGVKAPKSTNTFQDVAVNGEYSGKSLMTRNYEKTGTYYARGYAYSDLPEGSKVLFKSLENGEDAFIGGFQATNSDKSVFGDKITMFSKILNGKDFAKPVNAVAIGQQMDYRSHYQKLLPILATSIYASAAGLIDDLQAPVIDEDVEIDGNAFTISASDEESGIKSLKVYVLGEVDPETGLPEETAIDETDETSSTFSLDPSKSVTLKAVAEDVAGFAVERTFEYDAGSGEITADEQKDVEDGRTEEQRLLDEANDKAKAAEKAAEKAKAAEEEAKAAEAAAKEAEARAKAAAEAEAKAKAAAEAKAKEEAEARAAAEAAAKAAEEAKAIADENAKELAKAAETAAKAAEEAAKQAKEAQSKAEAAEKKTAETAKQAKDAEKKAADANKRAEEAGKKAAEAEAKAAAAEKKANEEAGKAKKAAAAEKKANEEADKAKKAAEAGKKAAEAGKKAAEDSKLKKPAKAKIKSVKKGKKKATVKWKRVAKNTTGYEIVFTNTKTKMSKTVKVKQAKKKTMSKVVKKLEKGNYKVKVRAYNKKGDQIVYGKWSKAKKVKVK